MMDLLLVSVTQYSGFTVRPILGALGASLAASGNLVGPLLFFFGWNAIRMAFLWYTQEFGSKLVLKSLKTCLVVF